MTGSGDPEIAKRLRAARAYGGFTHVRDLAAALKGEGRGLGETSLRSVERGVATLEGWKRRQIAQACNLPPEFFTMDFRKAAQALEERSEVSQLRGDVEELREHLRRLKIQIEAAEVEARQQSDADGQTRTDQPRPGQP